jgi:uncharacterized repeat protein (TIGR01451 family)
MHGDVAERSAARWLASAAVLLGATRAQAQDFEVPFHDCCTWTYVSCDLQQPNLPRACQQAHQLVDPLASCDPLCCIGHTASDPCPILNACIDDVCPCEPVLPATECADAAPGRSRASAVSALDSDGDGLPDAWEINGVDVDGDGIIDIDLPGMGADPKHKDLFLELDVMAGEAPRRSAILAMKAAFALAPANAGGRLNPDGTPGIHLWVDMGASSDPSASEDGAGPGTCSDGIDNGLDGLMDGADPDCLVGDNLGGGNVLPASDICNLDASFLAAKASNFNPARARVFRYGISARGCDADSDGQIDSGGWGEIGGGDFVEYNHDGGTIMHELGHTLYLRHGGNEDANCKPNYVSVMNYDEQFGINQLGGSSILDFSPPRFPGGRGMAPLPPLTENNLDEGVVLDPTDLINRFVFVNASGAKVRAQLSGNPNYSATPALPALESGLSVNIDTVSAEGTPASCKNSSSKSVLTGYDDWSNIRFTFDGSGTADGASGSGTPTPVSEPPLRQILLHQRVLNTTDLVITKAALPSVVIAGAPLTYLLAVANRGPNPASKVLLSDALPEGTTLIAGADQCTANNPLSLACDFGEVLPGQQVEIAVVLAVAPALVYAQGRPVALAHHAQVENLVGPDSDLENNTVDFAIPVVAVADLGLTRMEFVAGSRRARVGQQRTERTPLGEPAQALVGELVSLDFRSLLGSGGPSSPMDVQISPSASAPPDSWVEAPRDPPFEPALLQGEQREVRERVKLECRGPGSHTFSSTLRVHPHLSADSDPNPANDAVTKPGRLSCRGAVHRRRRKWLAARVRCDPNRPGQRAVRRPRNLECEPRVEPHRESAALRRQSPATRARRRRSRPDTSL